MKLVKRHTESKLENIENEILEIQMDAKRFFCYVHENNSISVFTSVNIDFSLV